MSQSVKQISILGSTGSIGTQTLDIVEQSQKGGDGRLEVAALAAGGGRIDLLERQIRRFRPKMAAVWDKEKATLLAKKVSDLSVRIEGGMDGMIEAATWPSARITVTAMVGMIGIRPTMMAIEAGKDIALANKETLVTAGHLIMPMARRKGVRILPVDSEHSAIFQCLQGRGSQPIEKILLTASGGPFRGKSKEQLEHVTVEDALHHPNWSMGSKITIDSSTLANKGLEVMEAGWLFDVPVDDVQVVVQPTSVIHSMVQFADGAVMAQLGTPDMHLPIAYALYYPDRYPLPGERLDFTKLSGIAFDVPDTRTFPALSLAFEAGRIRGTMPTVFNAANERAVALFLSGKIRYLDIPDIIGHCMASHKAADDPTLEQILDTEKETYEMIAERWG